MSALERSPFAYTVLRAVPRVERAEFINAGVVLFCRERRFLDARTALDAARLAALAPDCYADEIVAQLVATERVARGETGAGPIAMLSQSERFHWLSSPSSTMVQRAEAHTGLTDDPAATLDHLFRTQVMTPGARLPRHEGWSRAHRLAATPEFVGRTIARVRRLHYEYGGEVNAVDGPIELTFADGSAVLCDAAADWTLEFFGKAWVEPFPEPLSESDREHIDRYGRWLAYDMSERSPFSLLVGRKVTQVIPKFNGLLELTGLVIRTTGAVLDIQLWAGELRVFVRLG